MNQFEDRLVTEGRAKQPGAAVLLLPRSDGQYSEHAPDVLGLLSEFGIESDYATDPMATGVHAEKAADVILPILFIIGSVGNLATTIDGLVYVARYFLDRVAPR